MPVGAIFEAPSRYVGPDHAVWILWVVAVAWPAYVLHSLAVHRSLPSRWRPRFAPRSGDVWTLPILVWGLLATARVWETLQAGGGCYRDPARCLWELIGGSAAGLAAALLGPMAVGAGWWLARGSLPVRSPRLAVPARLTLLMLVAVWYGAMRAFAPFGR